MSADSANPGQIPSGSILDIISKARRKVNNQFGKMLTAGTDTPGITCHTSAVASASHVFSSPVRYGEIFS